MKTRQYKIKSDTLKLYKSPSIFAKVDSSLKKGQKCQIVIGWTKSVIDKKNDKKYVNTFVKLKSNDKYFYVKLNSLTMVNPGEIICDIAKEIGDYIVKNKYTYGTSDPNRKGSSSTFKGSKVAGYKNTTCLRYVGWVLQHAGFLEKGKLVNHNLSGKQYLIDCNIIKVNAKFTDLLNNNKLKAGDILIGDNPNFGCIYAGKHSDKKYFYECGGPFKGVNTTKDKPYRFISVGPMYVPYDYNNKVNYIIRANGAGNTGIEL